jgi:hypothetical protein
VEKNARRAAALVGTCAALALLGTTQLTGVAFADGSGAEEGIIFSNAKESVSGSLAQAITAQVAYSATWKVDRPVGYLHADADAKSVHGEYGSYNGCCRWIVSRQGTALFPYHVLAFWHTS